MALPDLLVRLLGDTSDFDAKFGQSARNLESVGRRFTRIGSHLSVGLTAPLAAVGGLSLRASLEFEQAMAGVAKTVDATEPELQALGRAFVEMSEDIPVAKDALAEIGEQAGQLGILTENIEGFTRTMAALRVSTDLGDDAASSLARLANIMGTSQTDFDRLGSTIVALGNNLATTESQVLAMGLRIAGAGRVVGLTETQVLGLAGALSSVGIEAEAGGTAVATVLSEMASASGQQLERFGEVAGLTGAQFRRAFQEDAAGALLAFIEGLGRMQAEGVNTFQVLDEVGLSQVRTQRALLSAASASDVVTKALSLGNQAWTENVALTEEAERFYGTTGNQLQVFRNRLSNVATEFGDVLAPAMLEVLDAGDPLIGLVRGLVQAFADLPSPVQTTALAVGALLVVTGPLLIFAGQLVAAVGGLLPVIVKLGGLLVAGGPLVIGLGLVAAGLGAVAIQSRRAKQEVEELKNALSQGTLADVDQQIVKLEADRERAQANLDAARTAGGTVRGGRDVRIRGHEAEVSRLDQLIERLRERRREVERTIQLDRSVAESTGGGASGGDPGGARATGSPLALTIDNLKRAQDAIKDVTEQVAQARFDLAFAASAEEAGNLATKVQELETLLGRLKSESERLGSTLADALDIDLPDTLVRRNVIRAPSLGPPVEFDPRTRAQRDFDEAGRPSRFDLILDDIGTQLKNTFSGPGLQDIFSTAFGTLLSGGIGGLLGGIGGLVGGLFGGDNQIAKELRANREALERNTEAIARGVAGRPGGELLNISQALAAVIGGGFKGEVTGVERAQLANLLRTFGLSLSDLEAVADSLGLTLNDSIQSFKDLQAALGSVQDFLAGFSGGFDLLRKEFELLDIDDPLEQFKRGIDFVSGLVSKDLAKTLQGLDASNIDEFIQSFLDELRSGDIDNIFRQLKDLSLEQFIDFLLFAEGALDDLAGSPSCASRVINAPAGTPFSPQFARFQAGAFSPTDSSIGTTNTGNPGTVFPGGTTVTVGTLNLTLPNVTDGDSFKRALEDLFAGEPGLGGVSGLPLPAHLQV